MGKTDKKYECTKCEKTVLVKDKVSVDTNSPSVVLLNFLAASVKKF